jgi:hypothetical protein
MAVRAGATSEMSENAVGIPMRWEPVGQRDDWPDGRHDCTPHDFPIIYQHFIHFHSTARIIVSEKSTNNLCKLRAVGEANVDVSVAHFVDCGHFKEKCRLLADANVNIPLSYLRPCCHRSRFRDELIIHSFPKNLETKEKRRSHTKLRIPEMVHSFDKKINSSDGETEWPDGRDDRSFRFCRIDLIVMRWMLPEFLLRRRSNSIKIQLKWHQNDLNPFHGPTVHFTSEEFRPEASGIWAVWAESSSQTWRELFPVDAATNERSTIKRDTPPAGAVSSGSLWFSGAWLPIFLSLVAFFVGCASWRQCKWHLIDSGDTCVVHFNFFSRENPSADRAFRQVGHLERHADSDPHGGALICRLALKLTNESTLNMWSSVAMATERRNAAILAGSTGLISLICHSFGLAMSGLKSATLAPAGAPESATRDELFDWPLTEAETAQSAQSIRWLSRHFRCIKDPPGASLGLGSGALTSGMPRCVQSPQPIRAGASALRMEPAADVADQWQRRWLKVGGSQGLPIRAGPSKDLSIQQHLWTNEQTDGCGPMAAMRFVSRRATLRTRRISERKGRNEKIGKTTNRYETRVCVCVAALPWQHPPWL